MVDEELKGKIVICFPNELLKQELKVIYEETKEFMLIKKNQKPILYRRFDDKFGRDKQYTLVYFLWNPQKEPDQIHVFDFNNENHIKKMLEIRQKVFRK